MSLLTTFTQCAQETTKFGKITQNKGPFRRSRRKLIYDFVSVINTNLPAILQRLRDIAFEMLKIAIFGSGGLNARGVAKIWLPLLRLNPRCHI